MRYLSLILFFFFFGRVTAQNNMFNIGLAYTGFSHNSYMHYYRCPEVMVSAAYKSFTGSKRRTRIGIEGLYGLSRSPYTWPDLGDFKIQRNLIIVNTTWDFVFNPENNVQFLLGIMPSVFVMQKNILITDNPDIRKRLVETTQQPVRLSINLKPEFNFLISNRSQINVSTCINSLNNINPTYRLMITYGFLF